MSARGQPTKTFDCRGRSLVFGAETRVMGILNVTPDSFSDGGAYLDPEAAVAQGERLAAEGAAIIDVGGQSTRPGFIEVSAAEEIARVVPVITALARRVSIPLSIDTYRPDVARAAFLAGAHLLNDVQGLQGTGELARIAVECGAPVVAMHQQPGFKEPAPGDLLDRVKAFFDRTLLQAREAGLPESRIILDPGIGFHKTPEQNLELMGRLAEMRRWGFPVLLGASRKSTIGLALGGLPVEQRLEGTLATTALAAWAGVELVRVHDVAANVRAAKMVAAIRNALPS